MANYEHSDAFAKIKTVKEELTKNLTSLQYLQTLDYFLWRAIAPIAAECPSLYYNYIVKVVARQSLKVSAKYTSEDRAKLPVLMFNILTAKNPEQAFELSKKLYLNRGLLFGFLSLFINKCRLYKKLKSGTSNYTELQRLNLINRIEISLGLRNRGNLYSAIMETEHWDGQARWWKQVIMEKYMRLTVMQAQHAYKKYNHSVKLDDVVQVYLAVLSRAIDRCDSRLGVLTTFIQNWFKSANGEVSEMAKTESTDSSYEGMIDEYGDSIHDVFGVSLPDLSEELKQELSYQAKLVDQQGLVRTALGIDEYMPQKFKAILELYAL